MPDKIKIKQFVSLLPGLVLGLMTLLISKTLNYINPVGKRGHRKEVLIVRLDAIGDFILWLDAARRLKCAFPSNEYRITLLGNSLWTDYAHTLPYFDEVWAVNRAELINSVAYLQRLLKKFRSYDFDTVLHPVYSREFLFGDFFVWAFSSRQKIGMAGDRLNESRWQKLLGDRFYTRLIPCHEGIETELERNAVFMRGIGLGDFRAGLPAIESGDETPFALPYPDYYVVFPGASVAARRWPVENFAALIERIYASYGLTAVVCGGPAEKSLGKALEDGAKGPVVNLVGKTSLRDLVSVLGKARFFIGNETGAMHMAAAIGTPSICILGGGHYGRFIPYRTDISHPWIHPRPVFHRMACYSCNWECIYSVCRDEVVPCVKNVSIDDVFAVVQEAKNVRRTH